MKRTPKSWCRGARYLPQLESLEGRALPAILSWVNPTGGDWDSADNWDAGRVPTATDDAVIDFPGIEVTHDATASDAVHRLTCQADLTVSAGTLAISGDSTLDSRLTLSGGVLTGVGDVTVVGPFTWSGGTWSGPGHTLAQGDMTLGSFDSAGGPILDNRTLDNAGTATWVGTRDLQLNNGAVFNNLVGAQFDAQSDVNLTSTATGLAGTFNNAGTFRKTASYDTTTLRVAFDNPGALEVEAGTLDLDLQSSSAGTVDVAAGATLSFSGGSHEFLASSQVTGAGTVLFAGSTNTSLAGTYAVDNTTLMSGTVTFVGDAGIGNLTQLGGTLTGPGLVAVERVLTWSGGTMSGSGLTRADGTAVFTGSEILDVRTLDNTGFATAMNSGFGLELLDGAVVDNLPGAVFDVATDGALINPLGPATFRNAGTLRKTAGSGTSTLNVPFDNHGTVEVETGSLALAEGVDDGTFQVDEGATLTFPGGLVTLSATSLITGPGTVEFGGSVLAGTFYLDGAITTAQIELATGSIDFLHDYSFPTLALLGGTLEGPGNVTIEGALTGHGGYMAGSGRTRVNGGLTLTDFLTLNGRAFDNAGAALLTDRGTINAGNGAVFTNLPGATFEVQNDTLFTGSSLDAFNNEGTFRKTAGSGVTQFFGGFPFNNTGTVEVDTGTLALVYGESDGAVTVSDGATLVLNGGSYGFGPTSSVTGSGTVRFDAGGFGSRIVSVAGTYAVANTLLASGSAQFLSDARLVNLTASGGTLAGPGSLTVTGSLSWSRGTMTGTGRTRIDGSLALDTSATSNAPLLDGRTLEIAGTAAWTGTHDWNTANGAAIDILDQAVFTIQSDVGLVNVSGRLPVLDNAGMLRKTAGSGTTTVAVAFTNSGTLDIQTGQVRLTGPFTNFSAVSQALVGGTYLVRGTFQFPGANVAINGASIVLDGPDSHIVDSTNGDALAVLAFNLAGSAFTLRAGRNFATSASPFWNAGALSIDAGCRFTVPGLFTQTGGVTTLNEGVLTAHRLVDIEGGVLNGPGTVNGDVVNAGLVSPGVGGTSGILLISGNYTQTGSGTLAIGIGGLAPGSQYDQLEVSGLATLDGTLSVNLVNGFAPQVADGFRVLTFGRRSGDFAHTTGLDIGGGLVLDPVYDSTGLTLRTESSASAPPPVDIANLPPG